MAEKLWAFKVDNTTEKFALFQLQLREKIFQGSEDSKPITSPTFLEEFISYDKICSLAFGDFGQRLYDVATELDLKHPDIASGNFLTSFTEDEKASVKILQLLKLYSLALEHKLDSLDALFSKCATKTLFPNIKSSLNLLKNRQQFVRLFANPKERTRLRKLKDVRRINLITHIKKITSMWDNVPDLTHYVRFGEFYQKQLAAITARANVFKQMGLPALYNEMQATIKEFGASADYQYYGFQRIPITIAAILLGKMHNCYLLTDRNVDPTYMQAKLPDQIFMPSSNFDGYDFEKGQSICMTGYTVTEKLIASGELAGVKRAIPDYEYDPAAYPLHILPQSEGIKKIVAHLDNFPEAGGRPIFDHFVALVPGVTLPTNKFFDYSGKLREFVDNSAARIELDTILIREKYLVPALLGEKDGKFYFICFWE